MAKITIKETNLKNTSGNVLSTEIVYVPGFALKGVEGPMFIETLYNFNETYGTQAPVYGEAIAYPALEYTESYVEVTDIPTGANPQAEGWYELDGDDEYVLTEDTTVQDGKHYYQKVTEPVSNSKGFKKEAIPLVDEDTRPMFEEGTAEIGYTIARQLLKAGYKIIYDAIIKTGDVDDIMQTDVEDFYDRLYAKFDTAEDNPLTGKGDYDPKYITTGGYPSFEYIDNSVANRGDLPTYIAQFCVARGDCFGLIDHTNYPDRPLTGPNSIYAILNTGNYMSVNQGSYTTMFSNWYHDEDFTGLNVPGSFGYLITNMEQVSNGNMWKAVAGASRGVVPGYKPYALSGQYAGANYNSIISNTVANLYQNEVNKKHINAITNITPYGYCIWGNTTLMTDSRNEGEDPDAFLLLNIRSLACDIKKQLYLACKTLLFEQNTDVLWTNFQSLVTPIMAKMKSNSIISNYKLVKFAQDPDTGLDIPQNKIVAKIVVVPIMPVDTFEITLEMDQTNVSID